MIRWVFLLQEFYLEIRDKKGIENLIIDYLSQLEPHEQKTESQIKETFLDEQLFTFRFLSTTWFIDFFLYYLFG